MCFIKQVYIQETNIWRFYLVQMVQNCIFDYMKRDLWLQIYGLTVKALKKISVLYCYYDWEMLKRRYQAVLLKDT